MRFVLDISKWLVDSSHWSGGDGIPVRVLQHLELSFLPALAGAALAIPAGLLIGHTRRGEFLAVSVANLGRAIPSFAILSIVYQLMLKYTASIAFGPGPTFAALFLLAIPPILTNTYVGVQGVDPDTLEAARGMGMTEREVLARIEVPLAAPLIIAGFRTAAVQVVATATLAAVIGGGGLGRYIIDGLSVRDLVKVAAGAVLVAILAIVTELGLEAVERILTPRRTSERRSRRRLGGRGLEAGPAEGAPVEGAPVEAGATP